LRGSHRELALRWDGLLYRRLLKKFPTINAVEDSTATGIARNSTVAKPYCLPRFTATP